MDGPPAPTPGTPALRSSPRSAQIVLAVFGAVLLGLLALRGYGSRLGARPTEPAAALIDLNSAGRAELEQVPGVGPKLAQAIHDYRKDKSFRSVDELRDVKGVGPATFDKVRPFLRVDSHAAPSDPDPLILERKKPPAPSRATGTRKLQPGDPPVNANTASAEELQRLPGVGPVTARNIVAARPFRSVDDLDRVRGIGPKTLAKLRPFVVME